MDLFLSVILGFVIAIVAATAIEGIETDGKFVVVGDGTAEKKFSAFRNIPTNMVWWIFAIGFGVAVINYATPKLTTTFLWLAPLFMLVLIMLLIGMLIYWRREGGGVIEAIPFVIFAVLVFFTLQSTAWASASLTTSKFVTSIITAIPTVMMIVTIGFMPIDWLYFRANHEDEEAEAKRNLTLGRIAIAVTTTIILAFLATTVAWSDLNLNDSVKSSARQANAAESAAGGWLHFYNLDLQGGSTEDDFNFGPNAFVEGSNAKSFDVEFRNRLKVDPALAAASTAVVDAKVGTRYLGEFYESCSGDWAKTMNSAKERWASDQAAYYKELDAFFKFLDAAEVEIRDCQSVSDQMYMNPYTASGNPDVIVLKTDNHAGHELVYTFKIKDNEFSVAFRLECGFQPTDVAEVMQITPQTVEEFTTTTTTTTTTTGGGDTPGGDTPGGDTPTPDIPDTPGYNKDPNLAPKENTEPNDDPGPGPDTNSGGDSSTEEKSTNSTNYSSYDEYRKDMDNMNDTNASQKVGGDSNTPSTPSGGANVDSNASAGTGYGGVDKATEVTEPAKEADTGNSINSTPGEAWGGPSD